MKSRIILQVPFTFYPDPVGGTEIYVESLARSLQELGYCSIVAAPGAEARRYTVEGLTVYRFATDTTRRLELAYGGPDQMATEHFRTILEGVKPDIVHFHARTSAVSVELVRAAQKLGSKVVLTYHTPTVTCARGDLMEAGRTPCDGQISYSRCVACALVARGAPALAAEYAARFPAIGKLLNVPGLPTAIRAAGLIDRQITLIHEMLDEVDHVVAVCDWVRNVLLSNGVSPNKITLSRQGAPSIPAVRPALMAGADREPIRLAFFGRLDPAKGPDIVVDALAKAPALSVELDLFCVLPAARSEYMNSLLKSAGLDRRINFCSALSATEVQQAMMRYDAICVPSRGLETGPLVVLEAFGAGVPVVGSNLGGIAELVRSEWDGILVDDLTAEAWRQVLGRLVADVELLPRLKANVTAPRTMVEAAVDMAAVYRKLGVPEDPGGE